MAHVIVYTENDQPNLGEMGIIERLNKIGVGFSTIGADDPRRENHFYVDHVTALSPFSVPQHMWHAYKRYDPNPLPAIKLEVPQKLRRAS